MKPAILYFVAILFAVPVFGQEKKEKVKEPFPFDEFVISVNRTNMTMFPGTENRFGCGAGAYHSSALSSRWDYMYGLEYNYTSFFVDRVNSLFDIFYDSRRIEENITFHIHTVSLMPVAFRFNMGKNVKYFLESGMFLGLSFADKKGEAYLINPLPTPTNPDNYFPVDPGGDIGLYVAPSLGAGVRIPMKGIEWIVKTEYNAGISKITNYEICHYYRLGVGLRKRK